jgi:hypothetical protein
LLPASADFFSADSGGGGALEGVEGEVPGLLGLLGECLVELGLPGEWSIDFGDAPECCFTLAEWWLCDPPDEETSDLASA